MRVFTDKHLSFGSLVSGIVPGKLSGTFFAKATLTMPPGSGGDLAWAAEPDLAAGHLHADDDPAKDLLYESDFAPLKPRADVLLLGTAYAPGGRPAPTVDVSLRFGNLHKRLLAVGDRTWRRTLIGTRTSAPEPFTKMPLRYGRAFGGPDHPLNPLGRGRGREHAPNVEHPDRPSAGPRDTAEPAGFAPLPPAWPPRKDRVGTYNEEWVKKRWPWFPEDFDYAYFNAAPADQQLERFARGDEEVVLENLRPDAPAYRTRLPGVRTLCFLLTEAKGSAPETFRQVPMNLDTVWIDADAGKVVLVWRGLADVQTLKLRDVDFAFAITEPLSAAPQSLAAYRALVEKQFFPKKDLSAAEAAAKEDEVRQAAFDKTMADMEASFAKAEAQVDAAEAAAKPGLSAALTAAGHDAAKALAPAPAAVANLAAVRAGLATTIAELKLSNPAAAAQFAQTDAHLAELQALDAEFAALTPPPVTRESVIAALAAHEPLVEREWRELDLSSLDFSGRDLSGGNLAGANFKGAKFARANLSGADLSGTDLSEADLTGATLDRADLREAKLAGAKVAGASFARTKMTGVDFGPLDFSRCTGPRADFSKAKLAGAKFTGAKFPAANFGGTELADADFVDADLAEASFEGAKAPGATFDRATLTELRAAEEADFTGASFVGASAAGSIWERSKLDGADLRTADLTRGMFEQASLAGAKLDRANLTKAVFEDANLHKASLVEANVLRAMFERADLTGADCRGANMFESGFWDAALYETDVRGANLKHTTLE